MKPFFLFSKETKGEGYVPNNEIFAYASGLAGQNMTYGFVSGWLRYFCINLLHMDPVKVGSVYTAYSCGACTCLFDYFIIHRLLGKKLCNQHSLRHIIYFLYSLFILPPPYSRQNKKRRKAP